MAAEVASILPSSINLIGQLSSQSNAQIEDEALNLSLEKGDKKKRRRHRRTRNKWKDQRNRPYNRLAFTKRSGMGSKSNSSDNLYDYGQPITAPYNTTQFLMDDHNVREPDFEEINKLLHHNHQNQSTSKRRRRFISESEIQTTLDNIEDPSSSDEFYSSPDDERDFMQKEFSAAYENVHAERLNSMSKTELVEEYLLLEERVENLENKLKEAKASLETARICHCEAQRTASYGDSVKVTESLQKAHILQEEIRRLNEENQHLRSSNEKLQGIMNVKQGLHFTEDDNEHSHIGNEDELVCNENRTIMVPELSVSTSTSLISSEDHQQMSV